MDATHAKRYPDLVILGFPMHSGCRNEALTYAIEEIGIPLDEIISNLSDDTILAAIQTSVKNVIF